MDSMTELNGDLFTRAIGCQCPNTQNNKEMSDDSMWGIGVSFVIAFMGGVLVGANEYPDKIKTKRPITPTRIEVTINPETMASDTTYIYVEEE